MKRISLFLCVLAFVLSIAVSYSLTRPRCVRLPSGQTVWRTVEWQYRPMIELLQGRTSFFQYVYAGSECLPGIGQLVE